MLANFIPATGRISFVGLSIPGMAILDGVAWARYRTSRGTTCQVDLIGNGCTNIPVPLSDVHGAGSQQAIRLQVNREGIELVYRINNYDHQPFLLFQLSLRNTSLKPIYLQELCLFQADSALGGRMQIPGTVHNLRFFKVGWHAWDYSGLCMTDDRNSRSWIDAFTRSSYANPVTAISRSRDYISSEGWSILANDTAAVVAGFASMAHQFGQVYASLRAGEESLKLVTQADGSRLDPGETCASEWGFLQFVEQPAPEPAADYVSAVARQMQARLPAIPPPMWTHWYQFYHHVSEKLILQNLDTLLHARDLLPFQVVELDDGYQAAWGDWTVTNGKFPHGLDYLADQIRSQGFTPGLWLAPLVVQGKSQLAHTHPDWIVKDQHGKPLKAGFLYNIFIHALDASHPAVLDHLRQLVDTLVNQWGYGMLKLDFLNAGALPGRRYNPKLTRAECLRLGLEAIRQAAGEHAFLLASGCPFGPAIGLVDAMRIGPDTAPAWEPTLHWLKWTKLLIKHNPSMPSLRNAVRHTFNLSTLHQRWWWNDPDCLLVRNRHTGLTEAEVRSAVTLVGLSGGMLVSSDDIRNLDLDRLRWVSLLVPNLGLRGLPLDWFDHEMPGLYRAKPPSGGTLFPKWQLVGVFNWQNRPADCRLDFVKLGFDPGADLHIFDFWDQRYDRISTPEMVFRSVPAHGCRLVRICEAGTGPQLVGDTLHLSQGVEISSWEASPDRLSIATIDLGRQVDGGLWLWLPTAPISATCNGEPVSIVDDGAGIYSLQLQFEGKASIEVVQ